MKQPMGTRSSSNTSASIWMMMKTRSFICIGTGSCWYDDVFCHIKWHKWLDHKKKHRLSIQLSLLMDHTSSVQTSIWSLHKITNVIRSMKAFGLCHESIMFRNLPYARQIYINREKDVPIIHLAGRCVLMCRKDDIQQKYVMEVPEAHHTSSVRSAKRSSIRQGPLRMMIIKRNGWSWWRKDAAHIGIRQKYAGLWWGDRQQVQRTLPLGGDHKLCWKITLDHEYYDNVSKGIIDTSSQLNKWRRPSEQRC